MKKTVLALALSSISMGALADSSYVTGNLQFHSSQLHGAKKTSTVEMGHTFDNKAGGFTFYVEWDGIQMGDIYEHEGLSIKRDPVLTVGGEQLFNLTENLWGAVGYQHVSLDGHILEHRPLFKLGYNFDNGLFISNRTRFHIGVGNSASYTPEGLKIEEAESDTRFDNTIGYNFESVQIKYNNVFLLDASKMDHEVRVTYTGGSVQPYIEYRNQYDNANNALVIGATYAF